jgi:hypothetical protein
LATKGLAGLRGYLVFIITNVVILFSNFVPLIMDFTGYFLTPLEGGPRVFDYTYKLAFSVI